MSGVEQGGQEGESVLARREHRGDSSAVGSVAAVLVLSVAGCSAGEPSAGGSSAPTTLSPQESVAPSISSSPSPSEVPQPTFAYEEPTPHCPAPTDLESLPRVDGDPYALDPLFDENDDRMKSYCRYELSSIGDGEDVVFDDHVLVTSEIALYRSWNDSEWVDSYTAIPLESDDLDTWQQASAPSGEVDPWGEGCAPGTPCSDGEEPTVSTVGFQNHFEAHVGNLEFYASVTYIADEVPADAEERTVRIFRDLVRTSVEHYARAEADR